MKNALKIQLSIINSKLLSKFRSKVGGMDRLALLIGVHLRWNWLRMALKIFLLLFCLFECLFVCQFSIQSRKDGSPFPTRRHICAGMRPRSVSVPLPPFFLVAVLVFLSVCLFVSNEEADEHVERNARPLTQRKGP